MMAVESSSNSYMFLDVASCQKYSSVSQEYSQYNLCLLLDKKLHIKQDTFRQNVRIQTDVIDPLGVFSSVCPPLSNFSTHASEQRKYPPHITWAPPECEHMSIHAAAASEVGDWVIYTLRMGVKWGGRGERWRVILVIIRNEPAERKQNNCQASWTQRPKRTAQKNK